MLDSPLLLSSISVSFKFHSVFSIKIHPDLGVIGNNLQFNYKSIFLSASSELIMAEDRDVIPYGSRSNQDNLSF